MSLRRQPAPVAITITLLALLALLVGCAARPSGGPAEAVRASRLAHRP